MHSDRSDPTAYPVRVQLRLTVPIPLVGTRIYTIGRARNGPYVRVRALAYSTVCERFSDANVSHLCDN